MTIEQHIHAIRTTPTDREQDRIESLASAEEMTLTSDFLIVEVLGSSFVVTN